MLPGLQRRVRLGTIVLPACGDPEGGLQAWRRTLPVRGGGGRCWWCVRVDAEESLAHDITKVLFGRAGERSPPSIRRPASPQLSLRSPPPGRGRAASSRRAVRFGEANAAPGRRDGDVRARHADPGRGGGRDAGRRASVHGRAGSVLRVVAVWAWPPPALRLVLGCSRAIRCPAQVYRPTFLLLAVDRSRSRCTGASPRHARPGLTDRRRAVRWPLAAAALLWPDAGGARPSSLRAATPDGGGRRDGRGAGGRGAGGHAPQLMERCRRSRPPSSCLCVGGAVPRPHLRVLDAVARPRAHNSEFNKTPANPAAAVRPADRCVRQPVSGAEFRGHDRLDARARRPVGRTLTAPWAPWPAPVRFIDLTAPVTVGLWCNSDWSIGNESNPAYCRTNGTGSVGGKLPQIQQMTATTATRGLPWHRPYGSAEYRQVDRLFKGRHRWRVEGRMDQRAEGRDPKYFYQNDKHPMVRCHQSAVAAPGDL